MRCGEGPVATQTRSRKPTPRHEIIDRTIFSEPEKIAFRVADPKQSGVGNRLILWLTVDENQLRRIIGDVNLWQFFSWRSGKTGAHVFPVIVFGQFTETVRQFACVGPVA